MKRHYQQDCCDAGQAFALGLRPISLGAGPVSVPECLCKKKCVHGDVTCQLSAPPVEPEGPMSREGRGRPAGEQLDPLEAGEIPIEKAYGERLNELE